MQHEQRNVNKCDQFVFTTYDSSVNQRPNRFDHLLLADILNVACAVRNCRPENCKLPTWLRGNF